MAIETVSQHAGRYTEQQYRDILASVAERASALKAVITAAQESLTSPDLLGTLIDSAYYLINDIGAISDDASGGDIVGSWAVWKHGPGFATANRPQQ